MDENELQQRYTEWPEMIRLIPKMQSAVKAGLDRHLSAPERGAGQHDELDELRAVMEIFQQKYTFDIIFVLSGERRLFFNDLRAHLRDINPTTLSKRLKGLEEWGFVRRDVQAGQPVRVAYELTRKGNATFDLLLPLLVYVQHADEFDNRVDTGEEPP
jgi:DNA-binding HxlR family transcriptional regulator